MFNYLKKKNLFIRSIWAKPGLNDSNLPFFTFCLSTCLAPWWPRRKDPSHKTPPCFCISVFICCSHYSSTTFLCSSIELGTYIFSVFKDPCIFCAIVARTHTHSNAHSHTHSPAHACMSAVFLPEVPSHIRPALIIKGRGVKVDPLSVELRAGDPLIHSSGFVWASGLTHLPTPQASAGPWSEGQLLFSSNNCS